MQIVKCKLDDVEKLAVMNKQLIDAEKSNNTMSIKELENRYEDHILLVPDRSMEYGNP